MREFNPAAAENVLLDYISKGTYSLRSISQKNKDLAQDELKQQLLSTDEKRHLFTVNNLNIVAKFVAKDVSVVDHRGLISDILDYVRSEALSQIITLDKKTFLADGCDTDISVADPYLYKPCYYTKFTPNKFGKSFNIGIEDDVVDLPQDELLRRIFYYKGLREMYDRFHHNTMIQFIPMEELSYKTAVGTVSKVQKPAKWDIHQIAQDFGDDFLIQHGKVSLTQLEKFFDIGALPREILQAHKQVIDRNLEFHVMTEEAEKRALEVFHRKLAAKSEAQLARYYG